MTTNQILQGNNLDILPTIPANSVDSIVTDPPYELGFMGKQWDASGIAYNVELWRECLRVLKPGGHLLAFGGTRTYHRMAVAIEDAGFEIRDSIHWIYGSGFPKSLDVSKAIDKAADAKREVVGERRFGTTSTGQGSGWNPNAVAATGRQDVTAPATDAAKQWQGWGTALKPAHEPIVLARKPLNSTVAANVLTHGTGALNIDGCRIRRDINDTSHAGHRTATFGTQTTVSGGDGSGGWTQHNEGRWPANVIFDETAGAELDSQSGISKSQGGRIGKKEQGTVAIGGAGTYEQGDLGYGDTGGASRFFYCPKPSKAERNAGLDGLESKRHADRVKDDGVGGDNPRNRSNNAKKNFHPTVKPLALMRYLIRLVTPPEGTVLDPFAGSGTTLTAATLENKNSIGIELTAEYIPIIQARTQWAERQAGNQQLVLEL